MEDETTNKTTNNSENINKKQKKKRKLFQMDLTPYKIHLFEKISEIEEFVGLNQSKMIEKIMEIALKQPESFEEFLTTEENSISLLKEVNLLLGSSLKEIAIEMKKMNKKIDRLELELKNNQEGSSLFGDDL